MLVRGTTMLRGIDVLVGRGVPDGRYPLGSMACLWRWTSK